MGMLKGFLIKLRQRLRIVLSSKVLVVTLAIGSLCFTMLFTYFLRNYNFGSAQANANTLEVFYEQALRGKKAVSVVFPSNKVPLDLLYPSVKVDVACKNSYGDPEYIVKDVFVVGLNVYEEGTLVKITLAVTEAQSERIIKNTSDLDILVRGDNKNSNDNNDIEIVEM